VIERTGDGPMAPTPATSGAGPRTAPLLEVRGLTSGYGEVQILWDASLALHAGQLTTLIGSNGAGKTTLLRSIMGQIHPWGGTVEFDGHDLRRMAPHAKADLGLVLVPEGRQLFTDMTVYENLELGAINRRARGRFSTNVQRVFDLFPRLKERRNQRTATLSGGEQQMVAVARGLMAEPKVLMLDELSLGLSPLLTINLFEALQTLRDNGLTMLLVEQNVRLALTVSDVAYVLSEGRTVLSGPAEEVEHNEEVRRAYLGV
jgi:branched-chain amino acid transport system ATP-binding protein